MTAAELKALESAAQSGDAAAQCSLGAAYATGDGMPRNLTEAVRWYMRASEQGHSYATYNLATMYLLGEGVRAAKRRACLLLRKAERLGSSDASMVLGDMALIASRPDPRQALQHFILATARGDERGVLMIAETLKKMGRSHLLQDVARVFEESAVRLGHSAGRKLPLRGGRAIERERTRESESGPTLDGKPPTRRGATRRSRTAT